MSNDMTRSRFWQEAALAAVPGVLAAVPRDSIVAAMDDESGLAAEALARGVSRVAFEIAERMFESHGMPLDEVEE